MFWGTVLLVVGAAMLGQNFGLIPKDAQVFWPIILIALGVSLMYKQRKFDKLLGRRD
jgi:cadmium resistance protein CadD (predicted permease)